MAAKWEAPEIGELVMKKSSQTVVSIANQGKMRGQRAHRVRSYCVKKMMLVSANVE